MTKKHWFSALLAVTLLITVCSGCGTGKEDPSAEGSSFENITPTPAPSAEESPAPSVNPLAAGRIIVLDPGHAAVTTGEVEPNGPGASRTKQKDTDGTSGAASGKKEYELALEICVQLRQRLTEEGYTVVMTREDHDTPVSCAERAMIANDAGADIFVRIHADGSPDPGKDGAQAICITPANPYHPELYSESRSLSDNVLQAYCRETGIADRGIWETDTMTGNNWAMMPTVLLEMGFMTNANEDLRMASPYFQLRMVEGIVQGINDYFAGRQQTGYPTVGQPAISVDGRA